MIPVVRQNTINFTANGLKPFTRIYVFFDSKNVNIHVTPNASGAFGIIGGSFSDIETPVAGSTLLSDGRGDCRGTFVIPDPKISGNPRFSTGNIEFLLSSADQRGGTHTTYAESVYSATGILDTQQETITSTRNAILTSFTVSDTRNSSSTVYGSVQVWDEGDGGGAFCLTYNMKVMLENNILMNVNKLKIGDKIMTNGGPTIIEELIVNHIRNGYYIVNSELEITNDHPVFVNGVWKRTEDLLIGDVVNGIRINTLKYISKRTPTVSIVTASDNYNVYCNENLYTVHGRYKELLMLAA